MALQKPFNSPYSAVPVDIAYFRIVEANMNFVTSTGQITVSVYESQQARDLGKQPLGSIVLPLTKYGKPPTDAEGNILFKQLDGSYKNGAGDTVVSIAALGLAQKLPLKKVAKLANIAAGKVCKKVGVSPITIKELK